MQRITKPICREKLGLLLGLPHNPKKAGEGERQQVGIDILLPEGNESRGKALSGGGLLTKPPRARFAMQKLQRRPAAAKRNHLRHASRVLVSPSPHSGST
jgi:hypothetical protein